MFVEDTTAPSSAAPTRPPPPPAKSPLHDCSVALVTFDDSFASKCGTAAGAG
jgi:hypothetical protein